jgi:hypothetical protein
MTGSQEQSAQNANALQCLTTEHFNLQTARPAAIAKSTSQKFLPNETFPIFARTATINK